MHTKRVMVCICLPEAMLINSTTHFFYLNLAKNSVGLPTQTKTCLHKAPLQFVYPVPAVCSNWAHCQDCHGKPCHGKPLSFHPGSNHSNISRPLESIPSPTWCLPSLWLPKHLSSTATLLMMSHWQSRQNQASLKTDFTIIFSKCWASPMATS